MAEIKNGGPAFPWATCGTDGYPGMAGYNEGMSLRDYFAAHAPVEPQPWFVPARRKESVTDFRAWNETNPLFNRQRYVQWPYAWADEMIKAKEEERC